MGQRLKRAIEASPYSGRAFAKALAAHPEFRASENSMRRQINKWVDETDRLTPARQAIIEELLGLPVGYLYDENPTATRQRDLERQLAEVNRRIDETLAEVRSLHKELVEARRGLPSGGAASSPQP